MATTPAKPTIHFKGDAAEFTGRVLQIHGGTFYEVRMLEGIHKGTLKVVSERYAAPVFLAKGVQA